MNAKMEAIWQRVLAKRAKRLGVSLEEAAKPLTGKPRYIQAAEAAAARRGVSVETVLADDLKLLQNDAYDFSEYDNLND